MNPEKIAFLVDSCADLSAEYRAGKPIYVVPLRISCVDGDYSDGEDIDADEVYRRQAMGELPRTSLPDMLRVAETLDRIRDDGYRRVVALPLSSGLSGTYNMIRLQCMERRDLEAVPFDTRSGALGIGMVVLQVWDDIQQGMSWDTLIHRRIPQLLRDTHPYFSVDTLEFLQKGGRIGKITALTGTLLNIKPLVGFSNDGQLTSVAKVRGSRQVPGKLIDLVKAHLGDHKVFNLGVENGGNLEGMKELEREIQTAIPGCRKIWSARMDGTLATYVGKGMLGAAIQLLD
ncbi:MAG: DegV family protein [Clostridiales bacterium]|nr:DegV family protein [Clostridiales bacterium]